MVHSLFEFDSQILIILEEIHLSDWLVCVGGIIWCLIAYRDVFSEFSHDFIKLACRLYTLHYKV